MMMSMAKMRLAIVIALVARGQVGWPNGAAQSVQALHGANVRLRIAC